MMLNDAIEKCKKVLTTEEIETITKMKKMVEIRLEEEMGKSELNEKDIANEFEFAQNLIKVFEKILN